MSETTPKLSYPYVPDRRLKVDKPRLTAARAGPLRLVTLPESLLPVTNAYPGWKPPLLRCGWRIDEAKVMEWAEAHNCLIYDIDEGEIEHDIYRSFLAAAKILLKQSNLEHVRLTIEVPLTTDPTSCYIATIFRFTNYGTTPDEDDLEALQTKLLEAGWVRPEDRERNWYLDLENWAWKRQGKK